jgi:hypothetical protein
MQKTIKVGDKEVKLLSSGATPIFYSNFFGRDFFKDLSEVIKFADTAQKANSADSDDVSNLQAAIEIFGSGTMLRFYDFLWIYAYNADRNIPTLDEWLEQFEVFPIVDIMGDIIEMMMSSISTKKGSGTSTKQTKRLM